MAYRDYSVANGFIVDPNGFGDFTTIGDALSAATSGMTIFIRPGTYTENPALVAGVNLTGFGTNFGNPNTIINGECTFSGSGVVCLNNLSLQTNSNYCLSVTGTNNSVVNVTNCNINGSNNIPINYTSSGSSSSLSFYYCLGGSASYSIYSSSGTDLSFDWCILSGSAGSAANTSAGTTFISNCVFIASVESTSSGGVAIYNSIIGSTAVTINPITFNGTGGNSCTLSQIQCNASSVSIGSSASAILALNTLASTNSSYAITGSGNFKGYGNVMTGTQTAVNSSLTTTTLTIKP